MGDTAVDMVDTDMVDMVVTVLDMDVDTMAITLARDPLMPPQKPMPGTDVDTVMVVTDTADSDIMDKKLIIPYLQRNIDTKLCHYTAKPSDYTIRKQQHHRCLLKKTLLKTYEKEF